jgi:thiol-disulfide isomerase/thioredoxin
VGQELVYRLTKDEDFREGLKPEQTAKAPPRDLMEWRAVVVRKNDDGSWRLVIRSRIRFVNPDGRVRARRDSLGWCDLAPNGSYTFDERSAVAKRLIPDELFCRLPYTEAELAKGWSFTNPVLRYAYEFHAEDPEGPLVQLVAVETTPYSQMHGWQTVKQYAFDIEQGRVKRVVSAFHRGGKLADRRTIELVSVEQREPAWLARFQREAEQYLDAYARWFGLCSESLRAGSVEQCRTAREKARTILTAGREQAETDLVRESYESDLQTHDADEEWAIDAVRKRQEFLAAARDFSTTWEAKHFDRGSGGAGRTFRLAEHRGEVVVLDFWGTNCEYCMLVAPQVAQLAAAYQGKGVVILGMFDRRERDDKEDDRAQFLIEKVYGELAHLEAKEIAEHYRLREFGFGYPAQVILDKTGTVRDAFVGYDADLGDRLRKLVEQLRGEP